MIETISLNAHWRCEYIDHPLDGRIDGFAVPALADFDARRIAGKMAWLERAFDLPMQDICISYQLQIDAVPVGTHLTLNGREFGEIALPFSADVTDTVALEDNVISFRVLHNAAGGFGVVRLTAIPC